VKIDKSTILDLLRQRGEGDKARQAEGELPDQVDTENRGHLDLLSRFGIDPDMLKGLADKLPGGLGDAAKKLLG